MNNKSLPKKISADNEEGFILVICLLVMLVLTVIGIAATNNTTVELQVAGNEKIYITGFYLAEAASYEGAQRLENEPDPDNMKAPRTSFRWLFGSEKRDDLLDNDDEWDNNDGLDSGLTGGDSIVRLTGLDFGVIKGGKGSSLKMTSTSVYGFALMGRSEMRNSKKIIEVGYKKRY